MADDPGDRGRLVIHDKVAQRIAAHSARLTEGVHPYSAGLDKLTGRELPRATVQISGDHARAHVDIAVVWPQSAVAVAAAVQRNVSAALSKYAALTADAVDVSIETVVAAERPTRTVL